MSGNWWRQDLTTPTPTGGRAELVAGMLGTRLDSASLTTLGCEKGWEEKWDIPWTVGLVTGESGTGKTSLIRDAWPGAITPAHLEWPADVAVVDLFPPSLPQWRWTLEWGTLILLKISLCGCCTTRPSLTKRFRRRL